MNAYSFGMLFVAFVVLVVGGGGGVAVVVYTKLKRRRGDACRPSDVEIWDKVLLWGVVTAAALAVTAGLFCTNCMTDVTNEALVRDGQLIVAFPSGLINDGLFLYRWDRRLQDSERISIAESKAVYVGWGGCNVTASWSGPDPSLAVYRRAKVENVTPESWMSGWLDECCRPLGPPPPGVYRQEIRRRYAIEVAAACKDLPAGVRLEVSYNLKTLTAEVFPPEAFIAVGNGQRLAQVAGPSP